MNVITMGHCSGHFQHGDERPNTMDLSKNKDYTEISLSRYIDLSKLMYGFVKAVTWIG